MKKTALTSLLLLTLSSCYSFKSSLGNYNLPTSNIKEPLKEGKVCNNEENFPFDINVDLTVETARKRGNISDIIAIEKHSSGHLFKRTKCIIVKGN